MKLNSTPETNLQELRFYIIVNTVNTIGFANSKVREVSSISFTLLFKKSHSSGTIQCKIQNRK